MTLPADEIRLLQLPVIPDHRGNLAFVEGNEHVPFPIRRAFWLYDVPSGETRAGHALKGVQQVLIALSGSFDVVVEDGRGERRTWPLNRPGIGLHLPAMCWRELENFSSGAVCLVLASERYSADAYYRSLEDFREAAHRPAP